MPITPGEKWRTLHGSLAAMGANLLVRILPDYVTETLLPQKQPQTAASYARKITKEDGRLDWTQPARSLWNRVRALVPWPGCYTFLSAEPKPFLLKIWQAEIVEERSGSPGDVLESSRAGIVVACGQCALRIRSLQRESGRRMSVQEFLAGHPVRIGDQLT